MKISFFILLALSIIGLLTIGNLFHEGYHYFDLKKQSGVSIKSFCAIAVPIPETDYDRIGFVSYEWNKKGEEPYSSEAKADFFQFGIEILTCAIFLYFFHKDLQQD